MLPLRGCEATEPNLFLTAAHSASQDSITHLEESGIYLLPHSVHELTDGHDDLMSLYGETGQRVSHPSHAESQAKFSIFISKPRMTMRISRQNNAKAFLLHHSGAVITHLKH